MFSPRAPCARTLATIRANACNFTACCGVGGRLFCHEHKCNVGFVRSSPALIAQQEILIAQLQSDLADARASYAALREHVHLLEAPPRAPSSSPASDALGAASWRALKGEVLRLAARAAAAQSPRGTGGRDRADGAEDADPDAEEDEDALAGRRWAHPQHVQIGCKEGEGTIRVSPLPREERPNGECLLLEVRAPPDIDARLALFCDEEEEEGGGGGSGGGDDEAER
jgi:hypothetical protein